MKKNARWSAKRARKELTLAGIDINEQVNCANRQRAGCHRIHLFDALMATMTMATDSPNIASPRSNPIRAISTGGFGHPGGREQQQQRQPTAAGNIFFSFFMLGNKISPVKAAGRTATSAGRARRATRATLSMAVEKGCFRGMRVVESRSRIGVEFAVACALVG
jgi:hypothetical protein